MTRKGHILGQPFARHFLMLEVKMMFAKYFNTKQTAQTHAIPGSTQVPNNAGGYCFEVNDWQRLDRFLVLGTEGGTYYVYERDLTFDNYDAVLRCIAEDGLRVVHRIVEISESGRAPKNEPALFALALCSAWENDLVRRAAFAALPRVARTGTHLFQFASYRECVAGWGRGMRRAIAEWYTAKSPEALAYQLVKYRQRDGWSHRDMLRLAHPASIEHDALFAYATEKPVGGALPALVEAFEKTQRATNAAQVVSNIREYRLTREMIPTEFLAEAQVWEALLEHMPMTAMIRNLATMTRIGLLAPLSDAAHLVCKRLRDTQRLRRARVHPIQVLAALKTYESGRGARSCGTWNAVPAVVDALNDAFYATFDNVKPSGARILIGLDVSSSMTWGCVGGVQGLTPAIAAAAMCMVTARVEQNYHVMGFADRFRELCITPTMRLDDVLRVTTNLSFGGTDCSLPMIWAMQNRSKVDAFIVYTDNETWAGQIHPAQALRAYREKTGIAAKLIVVGMTATQFSIADPMDHGMLDVVGFDSATPNIISEVLAA